MKNVIFITILIIINYACSSNNLSFKGDIENHSGNQVCLYVMSPEKQVKELIAQDILSNGKFKLNIPKEILPSRVWLHIENLLDTTFIIDGFHQTILKKSINDSLYFFSGSALQAEYTSFKHIINIQYNYVIEQISEERQNYALQQDSNSAKACQIRKERMEKLKNKYLTDAICKNPNHNLSIFILQEEKINKNDSLFFLIQPINPNSNAYKCLSRNFQKKSPKKVKKI